MFALRNIGDETSIKALASGLNDSSTLFRHEVAFVLGQVASPYVASKLTSRLRDPNESPIVRHECAEAPRTSPLQPSHMPPDLKLERLELQGKSPQLSAPLGPLTRLLQLLVFPPQLCPPL